MAKKQPYHRYGGHRVTFRGSSVAARSAPGSDAGAITLPTALHGELVADSHGTAVKRSALGI